MKLVILVIGIVVLAVGVLGALYGIVAATAAQAEYDVFCTAGQMPGAFCGLLLASISNYHTLAIAMAVVGIIGGALTVAALAMRGPLMPTTPPFAPSYPPPAPPAPPVPPAGAVTSRTCGQCGRTNLWTDRFCANCGSPLS